VLWRCSSSHLLLSRAKRHANYLAGARAKDKLADGQQLRFVRLQFELHRNRALAAVEVTGQTDPVADWKPGRLWIGDEADSGIFFSSPGAILLVKLGTY
jgi:hypothetical protein